MNLIDTNKLLAVQHRLFENAHKSPHELKSIAIEIKNTPDLGEDLYMHPDAMRIPMARCDYLSSLGKEQKVVLSAIDYALSYRRVAHNEYIVQAANMAAARCSFKEFSEDYMILFQETMEEFDHIWSFLCVDRWVMSQLGIVNHDYSFTRFNGDRSSDSDLNNRKFTTARQGKQVASWLINLISYKGMEYLPARMSQRFGLGAIWLFRRYLGNILLKQKESFLHVDEGFVYNENAVRLTSFHAKDEARHYTTSLELGKELFRMASPSSQQFIRFFFKRAMNGFIKLCFLSQHDRIEKLRDDKGADGWVRPLHLLELAYRHPVFADDKRDLDTLENQWLKSGIGHDYCDLDIKRASFIAKQVARLSDFLEVEVAQSNDHPSFAKYRKLLRI